MAILTSETLITGGKKYSVRASINSSSSNLDVICPQREEDSLAEYLLASCCAGDSDKYGNYNVGLVQGPIGCLRYNNVAMVGGLSRMLHRNRVTDAYGKVLAEALHGSVVKNPFLDLKKNLLKEVVGQVFKGTSDVSPNIQALFVPYFLVVNGSRGDTVVPPHGWVSVMQQKPDTDGSYIVSYSTLDMGELVKGQEREMIVGQKIGRTTFENITHLQPPLATQILQVAMSYRTE